MSRVPVLALLVLLLVQFAAGMDVNLYVVPTHHPGARPRNYLSGSVQSVGWAIASGPASLAVHSILGLLLGIIAVMVLVAPSGLADVRGRVGTGRDFIAAAGFNGASFLDYNHDTSSLGHGPSVRVSDAVLHRAVGARAPRLTWSPHPGR